MITFPGPLSIAESSGATAALVTVITDFMFIRCLTSRYPEETPLEGKARAVIGAASEETTSCIPGTN
jgi:hypothetical protein